MSGKFALIIGNTEYTDPGLAQLTAPGKDAEDFARVLKDTEIGAFDTVNVLVNEQAASVIEAIDEFFDQKKPDDLLVLYFSGHGIRDEIGSLYLAFKNTIRSRLRSTAVKSDYIKEAMDQSRSKRQVLVLDCCNSGAFAQGTKAATGMSIGTASAFEGGYGRIILTASDSTQFAWEGDKVIGETDNSLFTHFLVEGLEGEADLDGDGRITVDELYDYAYEKVRFATPKQTPSKFSSKQQGEIVLRQKMRIEDIKPLSLSEQLISEIENPYPEVRLRAIGQLAKLLNGKNLGLARSAREALERIEKEDDSRRVTQVATQILEPIRQQELEEKRRIKEIAKGIVRGTLQTASEAFDPIREEERLAHEKAEAERKAKEATQRLTEEKQRTTWEERLAREKAEAERLAKQKAEEERIALEEAERKAIVKAEEERLAYEKAKAKRPAFEKAPIFYKVWISAITKPTIENYTKISEHTELGTAFLWVSSVNFILFLAIAILSPSLSGRTPSFASVDVGGVLAFTLLSVAVLLISATCMHFISKALGGKGTITSTLYCLERLTKPQELVRLGYGKTTCER